MGINDEMLFEQVRDNLEALLIANQGSLFRTVGGQLQRTDAEEVKGSLRSLQVFYESGQFNDESSGKQQKEHKCEYRLEYTLSRAAEADIATLDDPNASVADKQAALSASLAGTRLADRAMDAFRRIIAQIILDPKNRALGFDADPTARGSVAYTTSRLNLSDFRKNQPEQRGSLILLTASETFKCTVTETFDGADVVVATKPSVEFGTELSGPAGDPDTDPTKFDVDSNSP